MPQISMGCEGTWQRWVRKPSVSKMVKLDIEDLDTIAIFSANEKAGKESVVNDMHANSWQEDIEEPSTPFDAKLDDEIAFPALKHKKASLASCGTEAGKEVVKANGAPADLTPEKLASVPTKEKPKTDAVHDEDDVAKDWVVVTSLNNAGEPCRAMPTNEIFDAQHPRNMFCKRNVSKALTKKDDSEDAACGIDWSKAGMPMELISRLIRGSTNPAHRGLHSQKEAPALPGHIMRAQNIGSSQRQSSTPKTPPRSQSRSRAMKQPTSR